MTSRQPPQLPAVTDRAGPCQLHGSVASRSPNEVRARGSAQSTPHPRTHPGSVISTVPPEKGGAQRAGVDVVDTRACPKCTWDGPPPSKLATPFTHSQ